MKKNPYIAILTTARKYMGTYRPLFIWTLLFFVLSNGVEFLEPYIFGRMLNTIQMGQVDGRDTIVWLLVILGAIPFVDWIFHGIARVWERTISFHTTKTYKEALFEIATHLPMRRHADNHSGQTIDKIEKATRSVKDFTENNFMYIQTVLKFIGGIVGVGIVRPWLSLILALVGVGIFCIVFLFDKMLVKQYSDMNSKEHIVTAVLFDYLSNIKTVITLRFEQLAQSELAKKIATIFPIFRKNAIQNELKRFTVSQILSIVTATIMGFFMYYKMRVEGAVLIGDVSMLFWYIQKMSGSFYGFARQYSEIVRMHTDVQSVQPILDDYAKIEKKYIHDHNISPKSRSNISIMGLDFSYQDTGAQQVHHLHDISLSIAPGARIALVGSSGSGKSTLMALIRGLYEIPDHVVQWTDTMGTRYTTSLHALHQITSLIPQDPEIFENTIAYNVSVGTSVEQDDLDTVAHLACFDTIVQKLPAGRQTDIKEKGVNLSGGEKQRLALARGFLMGRNSDILLLDEPTSSVDSVNEKKIYQRVFAAYKDICIISSIHKLHILDMFDYIYVLDAGRIVQQGTFAALRRSTGLFATMRKEYEKTK